MLNNRQPERRNNILKAVLRAAVGRKGNISYDGFANHDKYLEQNLIKLRHVPSKSHFHKGGFGGIFKK